jgi:hypothetical protein
MTTDAADSYRRAIADCVTLINGMAVNMRGLVTDEYASSTVVLSNAATLEMAAHACGQLQPHGEETGLDGRGA